MEAHRNAERLERAFAARRGGRDLGRGRHLRQPLARTTRRACSARLGLAAEHGLHAGGPARPPRRAAPGDRAGRARGSSAWPPRSATSSAPRCARSRSPSAPARRARARCPTSATRSSASASPAWRGSCAASRRRGGRERRALARARHLPLGRRAGDAPRRHDPPRLHAAPGAPRGARAARLPPSACARTSSSPTARSSPSACCWRWWSRAWRATTPTASSRPPPSAPGTSARRCASCSPPDASLPASTSSAIFDLAFYERHVDEVLGAAGASSPRRGARAPPPPLLASARVTSVADLPLIASGKVREMYDLGDRILMVASDRISTYDVVHPTEIPGKGAVLTGLSVFWFARTGHIVPNHFLSATDGVPEEVRGRALAVRKLEMLPVECVVRGYLSGSGWKEYQQSGAVCGIELRARPARVRPPADADLHARHQGRAGRPRREHRLRAHGRGADRRPRAGRPAALALDRGLRVRRRARALARDRPGRHEVRVRPRRPTARSRWATRCSRPTPRATGPPTPTSPAARSRASTSSSCATGPRGTGWDKSPPAPEIPEEIVEQTRARYRECYERVDRRAAGRLAGALGRLRRVRARVLIRPKEGILDPQGQTVERALTALGFGGVSHVHVGRLVELDVEDADAAARDVRAPAVQPADRGLRDPAREVRGRPLPRLLRRGRRPARRGRASARRSCSGTPTATSRASTR